MTISLPKAPDGEQYEDFVAACLRALGYFTETRLVLRDKQKEVLELDIVATSVGNKSTAVELFEAKKDGISFGNVFKLYGQRVYLNIPAACLVSLNTVEAKHLPVYEARGQEMGVRICHLPATVTDFQRLAPAHNDLSEDERAAVAGVAWFQQIAKRLALAAFNKKCSGQSPVIVCERARQYLFGVYAGFFQPSPLARAEALYSAYLATPKLAGEAVALLAGESGSNEQAVWNQVNDRGTHLWVQMIMHLETTARIRIVKNALDDFLIRGACPPPTTVLKIGSLSLDMPLHALPSSFQQGLDALQKHPHALRLPYLFQIYAELLGGFLVFNDPEELAFVERLTGVPAQEVIPALKLLDYFFAPSGGTMMYEQKNELLCLKMTPGYVHGGGAFLRQALYDLTDYRTRYINMGWLISRWHNALYHLLEPVLGDA